MSTFLSGWRTRPSGELCQRYEAPISQWVGNFFLSQKSSPLQESLDTGWGRQFFFFFIPLPPSASVNYVYCWLREGVCCLSVCLSVRRWVKLKENQNLPRHRVSCIFFFFSASVYHFLFFCLMFLLPFCWQTVLRLGLCPLFYLRITIRHLTKLGQNINELLSNRNYQPDHQALE